MLHVVHVIRDLDIASGGPSRSVPALAECQSCLPGIMVTVLYRDRGNPIVTLGQCSVKYHAIGKKHLLFPESYLKTIQSKSDQSESIIFHLHGLWSPFLHLAARFAARKNLPYVVSVRGMLSSWCLGHKSLKKKLGWWLYQKQDLEGAACLIASSEAEERDVSDRVTGKKLAVIPNGCDEWNEDSETNGSVLQDANAPAKQANLGTLHPVKGFAELIEAWADTRPEGWKLAIVGPDENGYRKKLASLITKHQLSDCVVLFDEVDEAGKWALMDSCELYIAPSKSENFGMAIAEALQSGLPVITTTGTPWSEIIENRCGWWVEPDLDELKYAISEATAMNYKTLKGMGSHGRRLIAAKYSWEHVAIKTVELYKSAIS